MHDWHQSITSVIMYLIHPIRKPWCCPATAVAQSPSQSTGIANSSSTQLVVGSKQIRVQVGNDWTLWAWSDLVKECQRSDRTMMFWTIHQCYPVLRQGCVPCCRHLPFEQVWFCGHSKNGGKYFLEMAWHLWKQREQFLSLSVQQLVWIIGKCVAA